MDSPPGRALVPLLLGAVAGPLAHVQVPVLWPVGADFAMLAVCVLLLVVVRPLRGNWWLAPVVAAACFAACGLRASAYADGRLDPLLETEDITVVGVVAGLPQRNDLGQRFRFAVQQARGADGREARVPPLISLAWYSGAWAGRAGAFDDQRAAPALQAGDRWRFTVRLRAPRGTRNPNGFDYELWLWEQGLQATGVVRAGKGDPPPASLGSTWGYPVERARQRVRAAILAQVADPQAAGVLAALVVGDQNAIERSDWDVFRATGVAHLLSISGLHVTMFAWVAAAVVGAAWRRSGRLCLLVPAPHAAGLGGLALATAYALFSGWGVPAQRTLLMLGSMALLRLSGRRWPWPVGWLAACAVVLAWDPWAVLQPGFWLSFVAVGVLFATGLPEGEASPRGPVSRLSALVREQGIVTLALAPLTLLLFGQVSVVGLLANLVAIPWVTLVVTPLAMAGVAVPALWDIAGLAVQGFVALLAAMSAWPWAVWSGAAPPLWAGTAGVAGGVLVVMRLPLAARVLGIPLLLPALLWQAPRPPDGRFELLAADIGQGNAVLVRTATHTLVYDAGPRYGAESDAGQRVLVPLLRALGDQVDVLLLSHRDADHTGGAGSVLRMQPQARLLASLEDDHALSALRPLEPCRAGQRWRWDGVAFEVLHPTEDEARAPKSNAVSCVLRVDDGAQSALLAGDIEAPQEAALLQRGLAPAQVLLVPHHGSRTSSTAAFLDAVRPRWALVQAGYRNRFGHPAADVLARYRERDIRVVGTAACGAAWWSSAQPDVVRCEREVARRYWQAGSPD